MSESEAGRLAKLYAAMSDGELEKVASEADELTDEARHALRNEIAKRELEIEVVDPEPQIVSEPKPQEWLRVGRYRDLREADVAKSVLDSSGIECMLFDHNIVRLNWFWSNLIGGVKLKVKPDALEDANNVLKQPIPEAFDYGGSSRFDQPRCPKCGSLDITFESLNKPLAYGSAWLGFPLPIKSEKWICNACGARWVEEGEPAQPAENP